MTMRCVGCVLVLARIYLPRNSLTARSRSSSPDTARRMTCTRKGVSSRPLERHKTCRHFIFRIIFYFGMRRRGRVHNPPNDPNCILSGLFWLRSCVVSVLNAVRSITFLREFLLMLFISPVNPLGLAPRFDAMSLPPHYRVLMSGQLK